MSRESIDIVDQIELRRFRPTASLGPTAGLEPSNPPGEGKPDHQPPLGVELTGYRLLNLALILAFGIWKAISSYRGHTVIPTTLELISGTPLAAVLYYVGLFQDDRPEICPYFFQVDLAPPILNTLRSSELHGFLVSLSTLQPAVLLLQFARTFSEAKGVKIMGIQFELSTAPSITVRNAIILAIVCIILGILSAVRQLMKSDVDFTVFTVLHTFKFLTLGVTSMSLLVSSVTLQYEKSIVIPEFSSTASFRKDADVAVLLYRYAMMDTVSVGLLMAAAPIILLFDFVELVDDLPASQLLLLMESLSHVRRHFTEETPWTLLYMWPSVYVVGPLMFVVRLLAYVGLHLAYMAVLLQSLSRNYEHPYYALHLCYLVVFFLYRFLATLPTWCSSVTDTWKVVCCVASTYWK